VVEVKRPAQGKTAKKKKKESEVLPLSKKLKRRKMYSPKANKRRRDEFPTDKV